MAINPIPVDQRVIDIDSRRFASIEKALVELITNSDDSYVRLEKSGAEVVGDIRVQYERHKGGALLVVADQAEGMGFEQACNVLAYGGAHSPLSKGEGSGRGFFGRGLKQAVYGLGHGWLETIQNGKYTRIDLFRGDNGGYLYDDGGGDRPATERDYQRLGTMDNGTRIAIVIDNRQVNISLFGSLVHSVANNIYLREVLARRRVELVHLQQGRKTESSGPVAYREPPAKVLLGPDQEGHFFHDQVSYPFVLTLKRALGTELASRGDERGNGLVVVSGMAVLDCQLFDYENQVGTEYLFGVVRCPALLEKLGQGVAIVSDEREGLNTKDPFVASFVKAVSRMIAPCVLAEQDKLKHLEHATTSGRTSHMIEHLLQHMNRVAIHDLGIVVPPMTDLPQVDAPPDGEGLWFTTPFYYRQPGHAFHVALLANAGHFRGDEVLQLESTLPPSMFGEPLPSETAIGELLDSGRMVWTLMGENPGDRGEITARVGNYLAWCEVVVADHAPLHNHHPPVHGSHHRLRRDHGEILFSGYELRNLHSDAERAVYSPGERKIIINTGAPTVQLYLDGRGHFRDAARLLLAELFLDVISDQLASMVAAKSGHSQSAEAHHKAKLEIIRRYGSEIHRSFVAP